MQQSGVTEQENGTCPEHGWTLDKQGYCPACEDPSEWIGKDED